jgi:MFS family permease
LGVALFVGAGASIAAMGALGWASDRLGRRAYLILATGLFGAGIAGLALSDSFVVLLLTLVVLSAHRRLRVGRQDPRVPPLW